MSNTNLMQAPSQLGGIARQAWRDLISVYYANTPVWRWLKSGALVFFGFFLWTGGSVLMSYRPEWTVLTYVIAYGFLLLVWGPLTHFVVVPVAIRLRRTATSPWARLFARQASKINLTTFLVLVVVLGTATPGVMMLEFAPLLASSDAGSAGADVVCEYDDDVVSCSLENAHGFDHAVLLSGSDELDRAEEPPYTLTADRDRLAETRTGADVAIELRDEEGDTLRRYVRTIPI